VEWKRPGAKTHVVQTSSLKPEIWQEAGQDGHMTADDEERSPDMSVTGRLEAIDLRIRQFRLVDDVGNRIPLDDVRDPETVAYLINQRVRAEGTGIFDRHRLKGLHGVRIEPQMMPPAWYSRQHVSNEAELAKPGPSVGAGAEVSDEEFANFMLAIKG
jgi:hypothetical protein